MAEGEPFVVTGHRTVAALSRRTVLWRTPTVNPGTFARRLALLAPVLALAACADTSSPAAPDVRDSDAPQALTALTCTASTQTQTVSCGSPNIDARAVVLGGQNQYVKLASSNVAVAADTFAFDVTVTNLIPQPLGTTNGSAADAAGVRVFFASGPTSNNGGAATVANPDGTASFTAASQPYFQYNGVLTQDGTSAAKRWKIRFAPGVASFTFTLYVSAAVQYPEGYVDDHPFVLTLNPNEGSDLPATVRNVVGEAILGAPVSWTTDAPATASVTGSRVTAGGSRGFANLTAMSGSRPGVYQTAVSVCPATVVTNGTALPSSIASTDCFSSFGDPSGRPTTSYYADLYRVSLTAGQTVTITMDTGDDLDSYLLLAGPRLGFLVAGNDDDDTGVLGVGSRITYTATESGVHVIEASTFNGLGTGNYTLNVSIVDD